MVQRVAFGVFWVFARTDIVSREARVRAWAACSVPTATPLTLLNHCDGEITTRLRCPV